MQRKPEDLVHGEHGPVVIVTARVCAYLNRYAELNRFRADHRGEDSEVDATLIAFRVAELAWRKAATGTRDAAQPELAASSGWLTTTQAATQLHIGERAVRKAIAEQRLHATNLNGRWRINTEDLAHYKAARAA